MKQKDIMHVKEKRNRFGELRFECYCSGKDPVTRKNKVYVETFPVPPELKGKKEIADYRLKVQVEFREKVKALSVGTLAKPTKILFSAFAAECAENIQKKNAEAYNYYRKFIDASETINSQLGNYYLHELTQQIIDDFLLWLSTRKFLKEKITAKVSLTPLIKARRLKFITIAHSIGLSDTTLKDALTTGKTICRSTAEKLCEYLSVPIKQYFDIEQREMQYAKTVNQSIRTVLHYILKRAANKGYISRNFASKDYADNVGGRATSKRMIYDTRESILAFAKCIDKEQNAETKITCALYLHLGIRGCEAAGLEWSDFTFKTPTDSEVHICRNSLYVRGFGLRTKDTKTTSSERTIILTEKIYYLLLEYKKWWDDNVGKLWDTDRLFVSKKGTNRPGQILREWVTAFERRNNLAYVPPHSLRKTNISLQGMVHAPQKAVQQRAGHAHYNTTADIYDLGTKDANQEAANLLNDFFA